MTDSILKTINRWLHPKHQWNVLATLPLLLLVLSGSNAKSQPILKWADFYTMINRVLINQTEAENEDELVPGDLLETGSNSRADLVFNEGTVVRAAAQTDFRFEPGMRRFHIADGTALYILRPGGGGATIETPTARVNVTGTTLWTTYNPEKQLTKVGVFASEQGTVSVSNAQGEDTVQLQPGQKVNVVGNEVGEVNMFSLQTFYETSGIADGLEAGDNLEEYPSQVRKTLKTAQENAAYALQQQQQQLNQENSATQNSNSQDQPDLVGTELGTIQIIEAESSSN
ncbi:MAG: FecR domain-containing protein [Halothece sp.]